MPKRWPLCRIQVAPSAQRRKVWLTSTTRVPCSNASNIQERKTWTQSEFCTLQNSGRGQAPPKMYIYIVPAQETAKHRAKFGWPPLSDVAAVTKPRRETRWSLLGCPKLPNLSQPLVGKRSPYCENLWRRYCCLTSFFRLSIRVSVAYLCSGTQMTNFWRYLRAYFKRAACSTFQTCILDSH